MRAAWPAWERPVWNDCRSVRCGMAAGASGVEWLPERSVWNGCWSVRYGMVVGAFGKRAAALENEDEYAPNGF